MPKKTKKLPKKPRLKYISVRIEPDVYDRLLAISSKDNRSLAFQARKALTEWLGWSEG